MRAATTRGRRSLVLGTVLTVLGLVLALGPIGTGDAAAEPGPPPITSYDTYPDPALFPDTCPVDGAAVLTGLQFTVNGVTAPRLEDFELIAGDTVTMSWEGYADGCETIGVSLVAKRTNLPFFDPQDNQTIINTPSSYQYSQGPDGPRSLTITVPQSEIACAFQIDAIIGPALAKVGPDGSYYSDSIRIAQGKNVGVPGRNDMLISAQNGGFICEKRVTVDKLWFLNGGLTPPPPDLDPAVFRVLVTSFSATNEVLGTATCGYTPDLSALECTYSNVDGTSDALLVETDGELEVSEVGAPPGWTFRPQGRFQVADEFVVCDGSDECVLTVRNETTVTTTTTIPTTTTTVPTTTTTVPSTTTTVPTTTTTVPTTTTTVGPTTTVTVLPTTVVPTTTRVIVTSQVPATVLPAVTVAGSTLPRTGSDNMGVVLLAYALIASGVVLLLDARRRYALARRQH